MNEHLSPTLSIDELAETMGISRRHLERLFKRSLGCSPSRHYLDLRLQQARQMLRAGELSLSDVATECGFVSLQHFCAAIASTSARTLVSIGWPQSQRQRSSMLNAAAPSRAGRIVAPSLPH